MKSAERTLNIKRETLTTVKGSLWHRTTLRCHETIYTFCTNCPSDFTYCYCSIGSEC